jgi:hypothetical protein
VKHWLEGSVRSGFSNKKAAASQIKVESFKYIRDELMRLKLEVPEEVTKELLPLHKPNAI